MLSVLLDQTFIFKLVGGLGLFLFGMKIMSEGLQKLAGDRMRKILAALTNNRFMGTLVGIGVTTIIQSSSATTVMVVGFVNAGLMNLTQAIGVVLGANIGTTVTAQIIAFPITKYALPAIGIGVFLRLFCRKKRERAYFGEALLGFGLLFFGLTIMREAFDPLRTSEEFRNFFLLIGDNLLLGVLIGAIMTMIVQSSTAVIAITLALASSGLLTFEASVALILGENIGTTITANLAAVGTNLAARRTALAHFLFNAIGVAYMLVLFPAFLQVISAITPGDADFVLQTQAQADAFGQGLREGDKPYIARHIANTHTLFNIINTLIFLPLVGILAKLTTVIIRGEDALQEFHLKYIDTRVLNTPPIALGQARSETKRMGQICLEMVEETTEFLRDNDRKHIETLEKKEEIVDLLQKEVTNFLVALSQQSVSSQMHKEIASLMHMVNDLERIGDYCEKIWLLGLRKQDQKIVFSDIADQEIADIAQKTREFLAFIISAVERGDTSVMEKAEFFEKAINKAEELYRNGHIARLNTGECAVLPGLVFIDMLHSFEKIGDHTFNVTKALVGRK
ncbi:Na/Pi cotransporter family protein [Geoalkalibacter halelectricus]|uniref:Na/Pi cotransporter family protein n=1 Tax=Geoalkalibacter halelectricus TaxID=2847045 RepID=A0ABY5ZMZ2_9BACT|nr:Na/Pi cotransporter family protein [Geoalkalibacter halelectricus]MDO3379941.1 Na/Pi cotransporter family protein [Geoalkalibacter halelectricus]UWZ80532.1 Na/Pi cotransporter family protein [Geoalkalibacter halelectricus]